MKRRIRLIQLAGLGSVGLIMGVIPAEATGSYKKTRRIKIDPEVVAAVKDGQAAFRRRDYDQAISLFTKAIKMKPNTDAAAIIYHLRADGYSEKGLLEQAMKDALESIKLNPKFSGGYLERGIVYRKRGEREKALADFNTVIRLSPRYPLGYVNRAIVYRESGDLDKAIAEYDKAIQVDPKFYKSYYNRAIAYGYKGDYERAIRDYTEAIRLEPKDSWAYYNRGSDYVSLGKPDRAIADYTEAIKLDKRDMKAVFLRAETHEELGNLEQARADFDRIIHFPPQGADALTTRGKAYVAEGNYSAAAADFAAAKKLEPNNEYVLRNIAWFKSTCPQAAFRNGAEAIEAALKACDINKWSEPGSIECLAAAYAECEDFDKAQQYQMQALAITNASVSRKEVEERLELYRTHKPFRKKSKLAKH